MFRINPLVDGPLFECSTGDGSYISRGVARNELFLEEDRSHFGMVAQGRVLVADADGSCELGPGMYFCVSGGTVCPATDDAKAFVVSALGSKGLRQFGGPAEKTGRLRYVDGCSDTLLLSPPRKGEPCLNHLHIPKGVKQRQHYHPSDRVGIILAGSGVCCADEGDFALTPGSCWLIPAGSNHHFETHAETLDVITWHPDSDFGPSDEDHPMINRTWVR